MPKAKQKSKDKPVKTYKVMGKFRHYDGQQAFIKEVKAIREERAVDTVYKLIGSQHRVKRRDIIINKIEVM